MAEKARRLVDGEDVLVAVELEETLGGRRKEGIFGAAIGYVRQDDLPRAQPGLLPKYCAIFTPEAALLNSGTHLAL
jgi:hypothetical protein